MIKSLLNQTLDSINPFTINVYGTKTLVAVHEDLPCRWQEKFEKVTNAAGQEVVSKIQCWIMPTHNGKNIELTTEHVVVYNSTQYNILAYSNHYDISGTFMYTKIFLK